MAVVPKVEEGTRDKVRYLVNKRKICLQEEILIMFTPNNRILQCMKQKTGRDERRNKYKKSSIRAVDLNTPVSAIHWIVRKSAVIINSQPASLPADINCTEHVTYQTQKSFSFQAGMQCSQR
jgi:hypothetical protein